MEKAQESSDDKQRRTYKIKQSFEKYSWSSCKYIVQLYLSWSLHGTIPAQHSVTKWFLNMEKLDWNLKKNFKYISNLFWEKQTELLLSNNGQAPEYHGINSSDKEQKEFKWILLNNIKECLKIIQVVHVKCWFKLISTWPLHKWSWEVGLNLLVWA